MISNPCASGAMFHSSYYFIGFYFAFEIAQPCAKEYGGKFDNFFFQINYSFQFSLGFIRDLLWVSHVHTSQQVETAVGPRFSFFNKKCLELESPLLTNEQKWIFRDISLQVVCWQSSRERTWLFYFQHGEQNSYIF